VDAIDAYLDASLAAMNATPIPVRIRSSWLPPIEKATMWAALFDYF
jgi:hypothetical protein